VEEEVAMPYGVAKAVGGDNATNDAKMEHCVANLKSQGKDEVTAIRICKAAIQRAAAKRQG
jgi:hypothetical protein